MGKGASDVGIGYYYHLSMHMILCAGKVDKITRVKAGDYQIWGPVIGGDPNAKDNPSVAWIPKGTTSDRAINYVAAVPAVKAAGQQDVFLMPVAGGAAGTTISAPVTLPSSEAAWLKSFLDAINPATTTTPTLTSTFPDTGTHVGSGLEISANVHSVTGNWIPWSKDNPNPSWGTVTSGNFVGTIYPATSGFITQSGRLVIDSYNAFGGKKHEGGFNGTIDVLFGEDTQVPSDFMKKHMGDVPEDVTAFRGVTSMVWEDCYYSANTSRPKPMSVEAVRIPMKGWFMVNGQDLASISYENSQGEHANPAHILAECIVDTSWGLGYADKVNGEYIHLDKDSFVLAAETLSKEQFGLSVIWNTVSSVEEFISMILQHINGVLFINPNTGKFTLRLIRNDYKYKDLKQFSELNVVEVKGYTRTSTAELINQVTVQWVDAITNKWMSMTQNNTALREQQGAVVSITKQYPGVATRALASKLLARDISTLSQPLAGVTLVTNREGAALLPGDVIKWKWRDLGVGSYATLQNNGTWSEPADDGMVLRISNVSYGTLEDNKVTLECIEDIFGVDHVAFVGMTDTSPTDHTVADPTVKAAANTTAINATYMDMLREANRIKYDLQQLPPVVGAYVPLASAPVTNVSQFKLSDRIGSAEYQDIGEYNYIPCAKLKADITPYDHFGNVLNNDIIAFDVIDGVHMEMVVNHGNAQVYFAIGKEIMELKDVQLNPDKVSWIVTAYRGSIDTTPFWIPANTVIYFYGGFGRAAFATFPLDSIVSYRLLTIGAQGSIQTGSTAVEGTIGIDDRWYRPFPPRNVKINGGKDWMAKQAITGDITVSWEHSNRVKEGGVLFHQNVASPAPEKGTTYSVLVVANTGTIKRKAEHLTGTSFVYTTAMAVEDGYNASNSAFYLAVYAVRNEVHAYDAEVAYASYRPHLIPIGRSTDAYAGLTGTEVLYFPELKHPINDVQITNFHMERGSVKIVGNTTEGVFEGPDAILLWDTNINTLNKDNSKPHLTIDGFEVKIYEEGVSYDPDSEVDHALGVDTVTVVQPMTKDLTNKSFGVKEQRFAYTMKMNVGQGGPRRRFVIRVRAHTDNGRYSAAFAFVVENPAPVFANPTAKSYVNGIVAIDLHDTSDKDPTSVYVYYSDQTNITGSSTQVGIDFQIYHATTFTYVNSKKSNLYFKLRALDEFAEAAILIDPTFLSNVTTLMPVGDVYRAYRVPTIEEFSKDIFSSEAYQYFIKPLKDLFDVEKLMNLANANFDNINSAIDTIVGTNTGIYNGQITTNTIKEAIQTVYQVIQAKFTDSFSRFASIQTALSDATHALTEYTTELEAKHGTFQAKLHDWYTALADDHSAMARNIRTLEAATKATSAAIYHEEQSRVDERSAFARELGSLTAKVSGNGTDSIQAQLTELKEAAVGYCVFNGSIDLNKTTRAECEAAGVCKIGGVVQNGITTQAACTAVNGTWEPGVWKGGMPIATSIAQSSVITSLQTAASGLDATIDTKVTAKVGSEMTTVKNDLTTLSARWSMKTDLLYSHGGNTYEYIDGIILDTNLTSKPDAYTSPKTSTMIIGVNKFALVPPMIMVNGSPYYQNPNGTSSGKDYDVNLDDPNTIPFGVLQQTNPDGSYTSQVYLKNTYIKDLTVDNIRGDISQFKSNTFTNMSLTLPNGGTTISPLVVRMGTRVKVGTDIYIGGSDFAAKDGYQVSAFICVSRVSSSSNYTGGLMFTAELREHNNYADSAGSALHTETMESWVQCCGTAGTAGYGASWAVALPIRAAQGKYAVCSIYVQTPSAEDIPVNIEKIYVELKGLH